MIPSSDDDRETYERLALLVRRTVGLRQDSSFADGLEYNRGMDLAGRSCSPDDLGSDLKRGRNVGIEPPIIPTQSSKLEVFNQ